MAGKYLGDAFDIHGGGLDLRFPHHENELAQSRAAGRPFATYWMHNAWVTLAGREDEQVAGQHRRRAGRGGEARRPGHPAVPRRARTTAPSIELSDASLAEAAAQLARIDSFLERAGETVLGSARGERSPTSGRRPSPQPSRRR